MASVQAALDLWQCCERHRISFREIEDLFSKHFPAGKLVSADDVIIAKMIGHIEQVEKVRGELLAVKPTALAPRLPMRQPGQAEEVTIAVASDRDDDDDYVELETDADRYPRPKGDEADAFDIHDNTIGYDRPDEHVEEDNFPEPDDVAPVEPEPVAVRATASVTLPAESRVRTIRRVVDAASAPTTARNFGRSAREAG
ncbi:hypothetical protein [Bradyrhizobium liaoningense]|uniref:hypothetical protein n=1 Tax=Bradyrhizobium liaoningense TaxID=43992 RepID=UPI001BA715BA|nr:hypothetical protein [Bradyrhizobium liaoningense]MBR0822411.1 hypothetical protein [Bradyrhizobium liaoningense]